MSRERRTLIALVLLIGLTVVGLLTWRLTRGSNDLGISAIILVSLDSMRADQLGCYGSNSGATPRLDRLAGDGVRFRRCLTTSPLSLPAHASILSGNGPATHGCRLDRSFAYPGTQPTLAWMLREEGFRTGAFVSSDRLDRRAGLSQQFDEYDDRFATGQSRRAGEQTVDAALEFVEQSGSLPFFLWVQLADAAHPYTVPEPYASGFSQPYVGAVAYVDACIDRLLLGLEQHQRLAESLVIVVGAHGEGLGEHGESTHGLLLHDSTLRVPLLFWSGGRLKAGQVVEPTVSVVSLAPTLLDLLALDVPYPMDGPSREAWINTGKPGPGETGEVSPHPVFFESGASDLLYGFAPLRGVEMAGWKLISSPTPELYRIESDPSELDNRYAAEPVRAEQLEGLLSADAAHPGVAAELDAPESDAPESDSPQRESALAALRDDGFLAVREDPPSGPDRRQAEPRFGPRLGLALLEEVGAARVLALSDPGAARSRVEELVRRHPDLAPALRLLGELRALGGDLDGAVAALRSALAAGPIDPATLLRLGRILRQAGDPERAAQCLTAALEVDPSHLDAGTELGLLHLEEGRLAEARRRFDEVLAVHPELVEARIGRAECLLKMNNVRLADSDLRIALQRDPDNVLVLAQLMETCLFLANPEDAQRFFLRARQLGADLDWPEELEPPERQ